VSDLNPVGRYSSFLEKLADGADAQTRLREAEDPSRPDPAVPTSSASPSRGYRMRNGDRLRLVNHPSGSGPWRMLAEVAVMVAAAWALFLGVLWILWALLATVGA
jgi:hypothetical protein